MRIYNTVDSNHVRNSVIEQYSIGGTRAPQRKGCVIRVNTVRGVTGLEMFTYEKWN